MNAVNILILVIAVVAAVILGAVALTRRKPQRAPARSDKQASTRPPSLSSRALAQASAGEESPPTEAEVTQMGALPADVLAAIQGKLTGEVPTQDEAVDVDLDELVNEFESEEPTGRFSLILVTGYARSDRGMKRQCNEDAFLVMPEEPLFVVADGMGGHAAGDVASSTVVQVIERVFKEKDFGGGEKHGWPRRGEELAAAIEKANSAVYEIAEQDASRRGMGSTVVAVRFAPNKQRVYIAHVGDSRCYRIRDQAITQLTEDHTLGNLGIGGPAAKHLARAVGTEPHVAVDLTIEKPAHGDYYLICSDGLNKMLPDKDIERIFLRTPGSLEEKARGLIDAANRRGGRDNITVIAMGVETAGMEAAPRA